LDLYSTLRNVLKQYEVVLLNNTISYAKSVIPNFELTCNMLDILNKQISDEISYLLPRCKEKSNVREYKYGPVNPITGGRSYRRVNRTVWKYKDGIEKDEQDRNYNKIQNLHSYRFFIIKKLYREIELFENLKSDEEKLKPKNISEDEFCNFYLDYCIQFNCVSPTYRELESHARNLNLKGLSKSTISRKLQNVFIHSKLLQLIQKRENKNPNNIDLLIHIKKSINNICIQSARKITETKDSKMKSTGNMDQYGNSLNDFTDPDQNLI
jgi:hypothetical protein